MLQEIRQWAHGWVAWLVIGTVAAVFVIWGIGSNLDSFLGSNDPATKIVKTVGADQFTQAQLDQNAENMLAEYKRTMAAQGVKMTPEDGARIKHIAQQQVMMESALRQFAAKAGFVVSKEQADAFINRVPQLQQDGHFSMDLYQALLSQRNQTPAAFLKEIQDRMVFMQVTSAIGGSAFVLPYELKETIQLIYQQRDIGYAVFDSQSFEKDINITSTDLEAYYNGHQQEFTAPAQSTIEYITLTREHIAEGLRKQPVPKEALKALYEERKTEFTIPESRRISHILIAVPENATNAERQEKKKFAQDLLERLRAGANFATLAKESSEDPGSAEQGGDLGVAVKGTFDPIFDDAAFAAPKDQVVGPVETPFGYHLILVTDIHAAQIEPLEEVRKELSEEWYQAETTRLYDDAVKQLSDEAFQAGSDFQSLAKQFGLTPATMTLFQDVSANQGIGTSPQVIAAAFDKAAYEQKLNSELLQLTPDEAVVLYITQYTDSYLKPIDSVKVELEKAALQRLALRAAETKAAEMQKALEAGTAPQEAARAHGATWQELKALQRSVHPAGLPYELVVAAFKTPMGEKPATTTVPMTSGVAILQILHISSGKVPTFSNTEEERAFSENLKSQLSEFMARRDFDLYGAYASRMIPQKP